MVDSEYSMDISKIVKISMGTVMFVTATKIKECVIKYLIFALMH